MVQETPFRLGNLTVRPQALELETEEGVSKIEHKVMSLLAVLAERPGVVWLREDLLDRLWPSDEIGDESLTRAVYQLRRALRDKHGIDDLIKTVPKRGYRLELPATGDDPDGQSVSLETQADSAPDNSIAVLPFVNMSSESDQEFFADGITEEILNALAGVSELRVTGRTSSFAFKGQNKDLREIATALSVAHLLEGSVRVEGHRIRVTAQLIRAQDGYHEWSEVYDAIVDDVFDIQDEIAKAIVEKLSASLGLSHIPSLTNHLTRNREAYALFLRGRQLAHQLNGQDTLPEAIVLLDQAVALDPMFSQARGWLALAHSVLTEFTPTNNWRYHFTAARTAAEHSLRLDPNTTMAWHTLGNILGRELKFDEAVESFERALETAPNDPETLMGMSYAYGAIGLHDRAFPFIEKAIAIDPLCAVWYGIRGGLELMRGDVVAAEANLRRSFDLGYGPAAFTIASILSEHSHPRDGVAFIEENFERLGPVEQAELRSPISRKIVYDAFLRQKPYARWVLSASLQRRAKNPKVQPTILGTMGFYFLDQPGKLMQCVLKKPNPYLGYVMGRFFEQTRRGERLRSHPGFPQFAERVGFVRAWDKYGRPECIDPFPGD